MTDKDCSYCGEEDCNIPVGPPDMTTRKCRTHRKLCQQEYWPFAACSEECRNIERKAFMKGMAEAVEHLEAEGFSPFLTTLPAFSDIRKICSED